MNGREPQEENDLFFVCSLIEFLARKTTNTRRDTVHALGREKIAHLLELADVYHCMTLDDLAADLIAAHAIPNGAFDNVGACRYRIPTPFEIGRVYQRLILAVSRRKGVSFMDALWEVYNSWISPALDDLNSSMYFENPDYIFLSYLEGQPLMD